MRVLLPKGEQKNFIEKALEKISLAEAARLCNLSDRTIRDWRREKFLMKRDAMDLLSLKTTIPIPKNFKEVSDYWYTNPHAGAVACIKKYGSVGGTPEYKKKKWREWWDSKGKFQKPGCIIDPLSIKIPRISKDLAEFTGIILGDGHINKKQIIVFTNMTTDRDHGYFTSHLIKKLFDVNPSVHFRKEYNVMRISVSRVNIINFCTNKLDLKIGHKVKQQVDIPNWIKRNTSYSIACVRGLMDTDGCFFYECHNIKNKKYCYPRLTFVNASMPLRNSVFNILKNLNLEPKIENTRHVSIEKKEKIKEYFKVIGSSNPKHLHKYYNSGIMSR